MRRIPQNSFGFVCWLGVLFMGTNSCQIPNPEGGTNPSTQVDPQTVQQITQGIEALTQDIETFAKPNQVEAWVDQLIVKSQPGKDMPQIGTMREGERAKYLYQRTVEQTEYKLRGQTFREPWILVQTQAGQMGWVHEGGVRYISPKFQQVVEEVLGPAPNARSATPIIADPAAARLVIPGQQVGAIKLNTSENELIQLYGAGRVGRSVVKNADGKSLDCTVVFPNSRDEIRVVYQSDARSRVKEIYIEQDDSPWYSQQGLAVGLPISELVKVNKAPISFAGFSGNYGGTVVNWRKGYISKYADHCYVVLQAKRTGKSLSVYQKSDTFTSNAPNLASLDIRVRRWVVYLD